MSVALVVGCAQNVWTDAYAACSMFAPDAVFAVKDMMAIWPGRVDYGITLHPDRTAKYLEARKQLGLATNFPVWAHKRQNNLVSKVSADWQGSSGLFAVKIALDEGFTGVVLAGVPMEGQYGHVTRNKEWTSANLYMNGWKKHIPDIRHATRSMSGWTKNQLGSPTPDWLNSLCSAPPEPELVRKLALKVEVKKGVGETHP